MPILVMAVLALMVFGTIGILLVVAVVMEHSTMEHPPKRPLPHLGSSDVALSLGPKLEIPKGQDPPPSDPAVEKNVEEPACVG